MEDIGDQDVTISHDLVKVITGQFDKSSVLTLPLCGLGIRRVENLEGYVKLHTLDLSGNRLRKLGGLEPLEKCLCRLDLRHNEVESLEGLACLQMLEVVYLQGNRVKDLETVLGLAGNSRLRAIHLQDRDGSNPNPVCHLKNYKDTIIKKLPRLGNLDGAFFLSDLSITDGESPPIHIPPPQPWLPPNLLAPSTFIPTETFLDSTTTVAKDLLTECDALAKAADTAIQHQAAIRRNI